MNSTADEFLVKPPRPQRRKSLPTGGTVTRARPSGRRPGDSGTREAIHEAARRQFAELGYDRTSLRGIAAEAGVDPALVSHFFGSKQQLFVSVTELPVRPAEVLPVLLGGDPQTMGERLARFILGLLESDEGRNRVIALVRAAAADPEAARIYRELLTTQLFGPIAEQLGADQPGLRAAFVGAQVVGLVMARYVVGLEPLASLDADTVAAVVAPNLQRLLTDPLR